MTAFELAARVDFQQVDNFVDALKEMRREAEAAGDAVEMTGDATDQQANQTRGASRETVTFRGALRDAVSESRLLTGALNAVRNPMVAFVAAAAAAGTAAIGTAVSTSAYIRELERLQRASGLGVTEFQRFAAATASVGLDLESTSDLLRDSREFLGEFSLTASGPAAEAYNTLGISARNANGSTREFGDVLPEIIDALSRVSDESERSALAVQILGSDGNRLIPILTAGAGGLNALGDAAERSGRLLSEADVAAGALADRGLQSLQRAIQGEVRVAFAETSDELQLFYRVLQDEGVPVVRFFSNILSSLGSVLISLGTGITRIFGGIIDVVGFAYDVSGLRLVIDTLRDLGEVAGTTLDRLQGIDDIRSGGIELASGQRERFDAAVSDGTISPNGGTTSNNLTPEQLAAISSADARLLSSTNELNNARLAGIEDVVQRERARLDLQRAGFAQEILDLQEAGVAESRLQELRENFAGINLASVREINRLEAEAATVRLEELQNRTRAINGLFQTQERALLQTSITDDTSFDERASTLRALLENELAAERSNLEERLNAERASLDQRNELRANADRIDQQRREQLNQQLIQDREDQLEQQQRIDSQLASLLQTQQNNVFNTATPNNIDGGAREAFLREALSRQIEQEREALNAQLVTFTEHEQEKDSIRRNFEQQALNRTQQLNQTLEDQNRDQIRQTLEPVTGFFEELSLGYIQASQDGSRSWSEVRDAAIINLQQILQQQLVNSAIQQALSFGLGLFGGGGAAAGAVGGIAQGNGVTSFPTSTPQAIGVPTRSGNSDSFNAEIRVEVSGNDNNPADVERAAQLGAERALNAAIDRRLGFQTRSNGLLNRRF